MDEDSEAPKRRNVIRLCGSSWTECGYCKGERAHIVNRDVTESSKAYTVLPSQLEASLYEDFVCSGWRRSGVALYKPDNWVSCCPAITIRLPVQKFAPTKRQRKLERQVHNLLAATTAIPQAAKRKRKQPYHSHNEQLVLESPLMEQLRKWTADSLLEAALCFVPSNVADSLLSGISVSFKVRQRRRTTVQDVDTVVLLSTICASVAGRSQGRLNHTKLVEATLQALTKRQRHSCSDSSAPNGSSSTRVALSAVQAHEASGQLLFHCTVATDDTNVVMDEASQRTTRTSYVDKVAKWWHAQLERPRKEPNSCDYYNPIDKLELPMAPYRLDVTTMRAFDSALLPAVHQLYFRYQHRVHADADPFATKRTDKSATPPSEDTDRKIGTDNDAEWEDNSNDLETAAWRDAAPAAWSTKARDMLEREYSHLPPRSRRQVESAFSDFFNFLVDNPLVAPESSGEAKTQPMEDNVPDNNARRRPPPPGTYHQHYRLSNGVLVAVGVVDVLPMGLSSVYLFYDPSFARDLIPMGKFAILREIEWTSQHGLAYYYLGYYIESCHKMRYKADYHPSELLCPSTNCWVDADDAKKIIQRDSPLRHCCRLCYRAGQHRSHVDDDSDSEFGNGAVPSETPSDVADQIPLDVGIDRLVTLPQLHVQGQDLVKPILQEFASKTGAQLMRQCIVCFR